MRFISSIILSFRALRRNPLRSGLTSLGIIIGIAAVIALVSIGAGARSQIEERIKNLGENLIMIFPGSFGQGAVRGGWGSALTLVPEDAEAIVQEIPWVVAASPELRSGSQVIGNGLNWRTQIVGAASEYLEMRNWPIAVGSMFTPEERERSVRVAVIGQTVLENLFPDGQAVGQEIRIRNIPFRVIGVLGSKGATAEGMDQDDIVMIPYTTYMKRFTRQRWVRAIMVQVDDISRSEEIQGYISALLAERHNTAEGQEDFTISDQEEIVERASEVTDSMTMLLSAIAGISLVVGGIGIMNIMLVSVTERTREIGIRLALGAHENDVLRQFLFEAVTVSGLGGILGVALGVGSAVTLSETQGWAVTIMPQVVVGAVAFSALVGIFFGYYPARRAARMDPIEALRFE